MTIKVVVVVIYCCTADKHLTWVFNYGRNHLGATEVQSQTIMLTYFYVWRWQILMCL